MRWFIKKIDVIDLLQTPMNFIKYYLTSGMSLPYVIEEERYNGGWLRKQITIYGPKKETRKYWYQNTQPWIECSYENGELNGPYLMWFEDGQPCIRAEYVNGKLNGPYAEWYGNGKEFKRCTYSHGKLVGPYTEQRYDGTIVISALYEDDQK